MKTAGLKIFSPLIALALFSTALFVLHRELSTLQWEDITIALDSLPRSRIIFAGIFTASSYLLLSCYDLLAIRYIGIQLTYWRIGLASFIGYTLSHNLGFSIFTGGAARFRLFSRWGLSPVQIAQLIAFSGVIFWCGFALIAGTLTLIDPPPIPERFQVSTLIMRVLGLGLLGAAGVFIWCWAGRKKSISIGDFEFSPPDSGLLGRGLTIAALDWFLASLVAYELLPPGIPLLQFVSLFMLSQIIGLLSHVPGGLGVFETIIILWFADRAPQSQVFGGLIIYRLTYYLIPLCLSMILFVTYEIYKKRDKLLVVGREVQDRISGVTPQAMTILTFLSGAMLLFSSATPAIKDRMGWISERLPLMTVEASHFFSGIIGMALILFARGLQRRLDGAWFLTSLFLGAGIIISLTKGWDFEEAAVLAVILSLLLLSRSAYYRKATLLGEPLTVRWVASIGIVLATTVWLIFFRYKHVEYRHELWWKFSFESDAPRSLRASVGAFGALLLYGFNRLLSPLGLEPHLPTKEELDRAQLIINCAQPTTAALALTGDKSLLFSESGRSFLMFGIEGHSWVAMGDPVGEESEFGELIWRFRELSDEHAGAAVFYQVNARNLHLYVDLGLDLYKLGEEAIIDLPAFTIEGKHGSSFRHTRNKLTRDGVKFSVIDPIVAQTRIGELQAVSDNWLRGKNTKEKGFSLGFFTPEYVCRFPVAILECEDGLVAFANLWPGDGKFELSVDLMRFRHDSPGGAMDLLLIELMLWGKQRGYHRFNLGMAPFSGFDSHQLAPLWNRMATTVFKRGERYYNFQGIRKYKEKFNPFWEPKYLAAPGGLHLPRILSNVAALIAGGLRGVVAK